MLNESYSEEKYTEEDILIEANNTYNSILRIPFRIPTKLHPIQYFPTRNKLSKDLITTYGDRLEIEKYRVSLILKEGHKDIDNFKENNLNTKNNLYPFGFVYNNTIMKVDYSPYNNELDLHKYILIFENNRKFKNYIIDDNGEGKPKIMESKDDNYIVGCDLTKVNKSEFSLIIRTLQFFQRKYS